jgi:hypothetical protein
VRIKDGNWVCAGCGEDLEVSEHDMVTTIAGASGKPNVRILSLAGQEIHRCELQP